jgi:hypothetical protein
MTNYMERYHNISDQSVFEKFIDNSAEIKIGNGIIDVRYKKKKKPSTYITKDEKI